MLFPKVHILLSTYNGERFLQAQLDSLQQQDYPNISIYIRDDGSQDGTIALLQRYQQQFANTKVCLGKNVGYIRSFFELVRSCEDQEGDLYAFCDQDDVWNPYKISRAVEMIQNSANPDMAFYCSRMTLVDENLQPFGRSLSPTRTDFGGAIPGFTYGCAVIMSYGIKQRFVQANPQDMEAHDWWACLIAAAFGGVVYDPEPQVQYRHHGSNTTAGYRAAWLPRLKFRAKELWERLFKDQVTVDFVGQSERFIKTYEDVSETNRAIVEELLRLRQPNQLLPRLRYVLNPKIDAVHPVDAAMLKLMILLGAH